MQLFLCWKNWSNLPHKYTCPYEDKNYTNYVLPWLASSALEHKHTNVGEAPNLRKDNDVIGKQFNTNVEKI